MINTHFIHSYKLSFALPMYQPQTIKARRSYTFLKYARISWHQFYTKIHTRKKKKSKSVGNTQITVIELIHITNTS